MGGSFLKMLAGRPPGQKFYLPGSFLPEFSKVFKKKFWEDRGILGIAQLRREKDGR